MRVFNLTQKPLSFYKKVIQPNGGSEEVPELNEFVPERDRELEKRKIIGLGRLPSWWVMKQQSKREALSRKAIEGEKKPELQVVVNIEPTSPPMNLTARGEPSEYPIRSKKK